MIVKVARELAARQSKLTAQEREDIMRTLEMSKDALAEGRIDEFEACVRRLESAARLLEQLSVNH